MTSHTRHRTLGWICGLLIVTIIAGVFPYAAEVNPNPSQPESSGESAGESKPPEGEEKPPTDEGKPPEGEEKPQSGEGKPPEGEEKPPTDEGNPPTGEGAPSTDASDTEGSNQNRDTTEVEKTSVPAPRAFGSGSESDPILVCDYSGLKTAIESAPASSPYYISMSSAFPFEDTLIIGTDKYIVISSDSAHVLTAPKTGMNGTTEPVGRHFGVNDGGTLRLDGSIVLQGGGSESEALRRDGGVYVAGNASLIMAGDSKITGCYIKTSNAGDAAAGAAVLNEGTFVMQDSSRISGNKILPGAVSDTARPNGGGVSNRGSFTMRGNSQISGNSASKGDGGGIANFGIFTARDEAAIERNTARRGGGIFNQGNASIENKYDHENPTDTSIYLKMRISGNSAESGGGFYNIFDSRVGVGFKISNAEIIGNTASGDGGGLYNDISSGEWQICAINHSEISGNKAQGDGGGIYDQSMLAQSPESVSYSIEMRNITFGGNYAGGGAYNIGFSGHTSFDVISSAHLPRFKGTSIPGTHPLNNYDISFKAAQVPPRQEEEGSGRSVTLRKTWSIKNGNSVTPYYNMNSSALFSIIVLDANGNDDYGRSGYKLWEHWTTTTPENISFYHGDPRATTICGWGDITFHDIPDGFTILFNEIPFGIRWDTSGGGIDLGNTPVNPVDPVVSEDGKTFTYNNMVDLTPRRDYAIHQTWMPNKKFYGMTDTSDQNVATFTVISSDPSRYDPKAPGNILLPGDKIHDKYKAEHGLQHEEMISNWLTQYGLDSLSRFNPKLEWVEGEAVPTFTLRGCARDPDNIWNQNASMNVFYFKDVPKDVTLSIKQVAVNNEYVVDTNPEITVEEGNPISRESYTFINQKGIRIVNSWKLKNGETLIDDNSNQNVATFTLKVNWIRYDGTSYPLTSNFTPDRNDVIGGDINAFSWLPNEQWVDSETPTFMLTGQSEIILENAAYYLDWDPLSATEGYVKFEITQINTTNGYEPVNPVVSPSGRTFTFTNMKVSNDIFVVSEWRQKSGNTLRDDKSKQNIATFTVTSSDISRYDPKATGNFPADNNAFAWVEGDGAVPTFTLKGWSVVAFKNVPEGVTLDIQEISAANGYAPVKPAVSADKLTFTFAKVKTMSLPEEDNGGSSPDSPPPASSTPTIPSTPTNPGNPPDSGNGGKPGNDGKDPTKPPAPNNPGNSLQPSANGDSGGTPGYVEIGSDGVPMGEWNWDETQNTWIFDSYPPTAMLPDTGSTSLLTLWKELLMLSLTGFAVTGISLTKRKD